MLIATLIITEEHHLKKTSLVITYEVHMSDGINNQTILNKQKYIVLSLGSSLVIDISI